LGRGLDQPSAPEAALIAIRSRCAKPATVKSAPTPSTRIRSLIALFTRRCRIFWYSGIHLNPLVMPPAQTVARFASADTDLLLDLKNPSSSSLTWSLCVVHMPCGAPLYTLRTASLTIFAESSAESAIGTI
jgi:hypothetical protein